MADELPAELNPLLAAHRAAAVAWAERHSPGSVAAMRAVVRRFGPHLALAYCIERQGWPDRNTLCLWCCLARQAEIDIAAAN